jgi:uncharacterized protein (DUF362 family)
MKKRRVLLRKCETYSPSAIEEIIGESLEEFKERPAGRSLIKPNVVCSTAVVQSAHTHPSVIEGIVAALRRLDPDPHVTIGESGGMAIPTQPRRLFADGKAGPCSTEGFQ